MPTKGPPGWILPAAGIALVLVIASGSKAGKFGDPALPPEPGPLRLLPKAGERWRLIFELSRPLTTAELDVCKAAYLRDVEGKQALEAFALGADGTHLAVVAKMITDIPTPLPLGQSAQIGDFRATFASAAKIG